MAGQDWKMDLADLFGIGKGQSLQDMIPEYPQEVKDEAMRRAMQELSVGGMEGDEKLRVKYFNQFAPEVFKEWQMQQGM